MYVYVDGHMHMQHLCWLDVNECAIKNGGCDVKRKCTNTVGGITCGNCSPGYTNDGAKGCKANTRTFDSFGYKSCHTPVANRGGTSYNYFKQYP